ncbi:MAG: hypothetical protein AAB575_04680 [Patescibacteria group bacterium]
MPLVTFWNYPKKLRSPEFVWNIKNDVGAVLELDLITNDVIVCFGGEQVVPQVVPVNTLIIIVELLFDKSERTLDVRKKLANSLALSTLKELCSITKNKWKVEVAVKKFNPEKDAFVVLE